MPSHHTSILSFPPLAKFVGHTTTLTMRVLLNRVLYGALLVHPPLCQTLTLCEIYMESLTLWNWSCLICIKALWTWGGLLSKWTFTPSCSRWGYDFLFATPSRDPGLPRSSPVPASSKHLEDTIVMLLGVALDLRTYKRRVPKPYNPQIPSHPSIGP